MIGRSAVLAGLAALSAAGCATIDPGAPAPLTVADTPTTARTPGGEYISWREHRIDDEDLAGVPIRGGDGLQMADIDRDGFLDIVSAQEDSDHLRIAFGSADPDRWTLATIAPGDIVGAIEDVAIGDLDGDGWPDLVSANEEAHLAYFRNPGSKMAARQGYWPSLIPPVTQGRGSWLRVFIADIDGDGRNDVTAANKGASDIVDPDAPRADRTTSLFTFDGDPLDPDAWREQVLLANGVPNTAMPVDIDADGDLDAVTGGYSGLNILKGGYTGATREEDHPSVTASSSVGRIAWFENPGPGGADWQRHDISRRVRGMYDQFIARDMDGDGDIDLVGTRGNSGSFDGVFWLEQVRSDGPRAAFVPSRQAESRALPLPPADWLDRYDDTNTLVAPNKRTGES